MKRMGIRTFFRSGGIMLERRGVITNHSERGSRNDTKDP
jgi:hypothetical protein